jgi:hypothetical protein
MEIDEGHIPNTNVVTLSSGQSLPFVEKYRPNDLSQIISHLDIV